jgi:hypothetical protein
VRRVGLGSTISAKAESLQPYIVKDILDGDCCSLTSWDRTIGQTSKYSCAILFIQYTTIGSRI